MHISVNWEPSNERLFCLQYCSWITTWSIGFIAVQITARPIVNTQANPFSTKNSILYFSRKLGMVKAKFTANENSAESHDSS